MTGTRRRDGCTPLRDYALIGNKRTAALVALDGAIDWLCSPGFAGPAAFAALLDPRDGGRIALRPVEPFEVARAYVGDTNVLETTFTTDRGTVRVTDAMAWPSAHALAWNQILRRVDGIAGSVPMRWEVRPRFGYGARAGTAERRAGVPVIVHDREAIAVEAFGAGEADLARDAVAGAFTVGAGDVALLAVSMFRDEPLTFSAREDLLSRLEGTADRWRKRMQRCSYDGPWAEAVRRSALTLDLLIDASTGAMVAAPTMALPERIGGPRNYDYRYAWVRDGNLTLEAMQRLRFAEEVHLSLSWMLRTVRTTAPRLQPMYALDGSTEIPDEELPLPGYLDSRPVLLGNGAADQLQLGNFGDLLDMTLNYCRGGNAIGRAEGSMIAGIADRVCAIWRDEDSGIWELPRLRGYTQSKLACWLALEHAADLADLGQLPRDGAARWRREAGAVARHVRERCWSERADAYVRADDGADELDAAVLLAGRGSFFGDEPARWNGTIDAIRARLGAGGPLVYRCSGMEQEEGAFVACSFWLAESLARVGRRDEAAEVMDGMVARANDVGLFAEEIDPKTGDFLGNMPLALSHLSLVLAADALGD